VLIFRVVRNHLGNGSYVHRIKRVRASQAKEVQAALGGGRPIKVTYYFILRG